MDHVERSRAVYGGSAHRYAETIGSTMSDRIEAVGDLVLLDRFVEAIAPVGARVLDAGCGTGRVARVLADRGLDAVGVDVADGMVEIARRHHPDIPFLIAELARLPFSSDRFAAATYWYSIITTPPDGLPLVFAELARVLADGGRALVAFQSGDGTRVERPAAYGTDVDLTLYRHDVELVAAWGRSCGLDVVEVTEREPVHAHEDGPQAFLVLRN